MTSSKPASLANFMVGKPVVAVRFACATLNWLISCLHNLSVKGRGLKLDGLRSGSPTIALDLEAGAGIAFEDAASPSTSKKISANLEAGDGVTIEDGTDGALKISADGSGGGASFDNLYAGAGISISKTTDPDTGKATAATISSSRTAGTGISIVSNQIVNTAPGDYTSISVVGTDGSSATLKTGSTLTFKSGSDSNLSFSVSYAGIVTVNCYYV